MQLFRFLPAFLLVIGATACGGAPDAGSLERVTGVTWEATQISGAPVTLSSPVTLAFADGRASGRSGCNRYSGAVLLEAGRIRFSEIISTKMACVEETAMQTEMAFLQALSGAETWSLAGEQFTISGSKGTVLFKPASGEPDR
jgi:heat shock protein HslJ